MASATLDTTSFSRMMGDLARIGGPASNVEVAFAGEVGHLLETCVRYTPGAQTKKIRERANYRFSAKYAIRGAGDLKVTMNDGTRGGEADNVWLRSGGKFHIMRGPGKWPATGKQKTSRYAPNGARWPDRLWAEYQSLVQQTPQERDALKKAWVARALASRGLLAQSWVQIGQSLGIDVDAPDYVRRAAPSNGRTYTNGAGRYVPGKTENTYILENFQPALIQGGERIMQAALDTRVKAFDIALQKGVFDDMAAVAARYPGLLAATP